MFTFRKFYEIDAPAEAVSSIASMMAKSGVLRQPGDDGPVPAINTEKKEEPTTAPATPAPATAATPAEKAKPEPPKPVEAAKPEPPQTATTATPPSWQEVLKTQQPDTILKELGYGENLVNFLKGKKDLDPKLVGFYNHWETNQGNVKDYLRALDTDFSKMAPEDVMKYQLQAQNPELDAKQLDRLYKLKVVDRYKLDPQLYSEEDVEDGRIELMADVKGIRTTLAEQQQNYLFPKPVPKEAGPDPRVQQQQQEFEAYKTHITDDPYTKDLFSSKKLSIGEGDNKFDFPVDPNALSEVLYDVDKWTQKLFTQEIKPDGTKVAIPDVKKQFLLAGIAVYGDEFLKQYGLHLKSLGGQAAIAPIENAKPPAPGTPAKSEVESTSPAAAAAKRGRLIQGGN
jgi:hypothetical protein